ncbi:MAG: PilZ domain-containing protein [Candidatus Aminicenantales bacterium]
MGEESIEKRECVRFKIPGATVTYKRDKTLLKKDEMSEFCPVIDISRGGVRFLTHELIKFETKLLVEIHVPGEKIPLSLKGTVRWFSPNPSKSYKYQIGVQFHTYGEKKDQNYPGNLVKIIALEQKFMDESTAVDNESDKSEFSI